MRFLVLLLWLVPTILAAQSPVPETSDIYARWRDRVVQVQVIDQQAQSKAGIGSGFFAGQSGWVVTNYHVIAELANQPGRYLARYLTEDGKEGQLELLAVDAVHDLAILRADDLVPVALPLAVESPRKGTRLYSLGYPYDIGLTIVEGTYNGMLEKSLYEKLHFTGSINPGMSGGPVISSTGEVVGVNVSTAGNQVSFLVPARFADELIRNTTGKVPTAEQLHDEVAQQLLRNQESLSQSLLSKPLPQTRLNHYVVPGAMAPYINCWGNSVEEEREDISLVYYHCQSQDDIFLAQSLSTGVIRYQHDLISTEELHPLRFYRQLERRTYYPQLRLDGDETTVTNYECTSDFVDQSGLSLQATFCIRGYKKLSGLYDSYLTVTTLMAGRQALQSTLVLAGFSWENTQNLSARFVESMSWNEGAPTTVAPHPPEQKSEALAEPDANG